MYPRTLTVQLPGLLAYERAATSTPNHFIRLKLSLRQLLQVDVTSATLANATPFKGELWGPTSTCGVPLSFALQALHWVASCQGTGRSSNSLSQPAPQQSLHLLGKSGNTPLPSITFYMICCQRVLSGGKGTGKGYLR